MLFGGATFSQVDTAIYSDFTEQYVDASVDKGVDFVDEDERVGGHASFLFTDCGAR